MRLIIRGMPGTTARSTMALAFIGVALAGTACSGRHEDTSGSTRPKGRIVHTCGHLPPNICVTNVGGTGQRQLTRSGSNQNPSWFPDGEQIVFSRAERPTDTLQVHVIDADGGRPRPVTQSPGHKFQPAWSPDGAELAFMAFRNRNFDIYVANADGSGERNVTRDPADDFGPAWSPDGRRLAFARIRGEGAGIYVMNADGTAVRPVGSNVQGITPAWSPDGSTIAYSAGGIHVVDLESGEVEALTDERFDTEPTWSPDGKYIAFRRGEVGPDAEIYFMKADGSGLRRLTVDSVSDALPRWSPK